MQLRRQERIDKENVVLYEWMKEWGKSCERIKLRDGNENRKEKEENFGNVEFGNYDQDGG